MISTDGYLYRTWQINKSEWSDWDKTGYSAPKSTHAPVVHSMDTNIFNGRLNVFVHGSDGYLHHIWQTTCDKVPNPWGWCTWSAWNKIGGVIPTTSVDSNTLGIGNNIHLGIEVCKFSSVSAFLYQKIQICREKAVSNIFHVTLEFLCHIRRRSAFDDWLVRPKARSSTTWNDIFFFIEHFIWRLMFLIQF